MFTNFRLGFAWIHTWFGLVLGFVLMAAFFFGSLSVFDREFDRWTVPATRFEPQPMPSFDRMLKPVFETMQPDPARLDEIRSEVDGPLPAHFETARTWGAYTTHRDPVLAVFAGFEVPGARDPDLVAWGSRTVDPRTGATLPADHLKIGSEFFYPMHYSLHLNWKGLGLWIVGLAALIMLVALITGIVMHRKIFRELFTFRPAKSTQRSVLDLHNMTGVVALPFHFFFAFTGLVIFAGVYFPVTHTQLEPLHDVHEVIEATATGLPHERAGVAAPLASVDAMVAEAQRRWRENGMAGEVGLLTVNHVGDANSYVSVMRAGTDRIALTGEGVHFRASTGEVIRVDPPQSPIDSVNEFLTGLHLQHFRHWLLRWLYVFGGLAGCVCIATGFLFFVEKRRRQHARQGSAGSRIVDALAVTTVTGMVIATLVILVVNRLLPDALPDGWPGKDSLERYAFWGAWLLAFCHAAWRSAPVAAGRADPAWREQCWLIAILAPLAVVLNWLSTGDTLWSTLAAGYWPVAGIDLALLATGLTAAWAARRLTRGARGRDPGPAAVHA